MTRMVFRQRVQGGVREVPHVVWREEAHEFVQVQRGSRPHDEDDEGA